MKNKIKMFIFITLFILSFHYIFGQFKSDLSIVALHQFNEGNVGFRKKTQTSPKAFVTQSQQTTKPAPITTPLFKKLKPTSWTMTEIIKDWLITPMDLVINREEIYVSGNLDRRIVVLNLDGQILRYYTVETSPEFDNICVGKTSQGKVLAVSSRGLWELKPDGEAEKLKSFFLNIDHMTIGPDDGIYVCRKFDSVSKITRISLNGPFTNVVTIESNRISDIDFDPNGNLFMFDAQHGHILKYSQQQGVEIYSTALSQTGGSGPAYLTFNNAGQLYSASAQYGITLISTEGEMTPLGFHATGDLVFYEGLLYTLDIYTSTLYQINIDDTTVQTSQVLLEGTVPWYIDHQDDVIVGQRSDLFGQKFYNYYINDSVRIDPNHLLNQLQPNQYTFDDTGNIYLLFQNVLKKMTPAGIEEFSITLPGDFHWDTRLQFNPSDDKIYYFDADLNSVISAGENGYQIYHTFSSEAERVFLTITPQGKIYAAVIMKSLMPKIIDISNPSLEIEVWKPNSNISWFQIASDNQGNLYTALGPDFQQVFYIDPSKGDAVSIIPQSTDRYDMRFVDPQGFTVTESGVVALSAPGLLVAFIPANSDSIDTENKEFPESVDLIQNYPNPFNLETTIKYALPKGHDVSLKIYNILGQEVRTLIKERIQAGYHSIIWDGRNEDGVRVNSGVYLYKITIGAFTETKRMILLK
ncbi:T9SS type A sorting domain-containing protein [candidate division KSB1 bacterium]